MSLILDNPDYRYIDAKSIVKVSATNFKRFKSFMVSRSIDDVAGKFKIIISRPLEGKPPFKLEDTIDIILGDGVQVMRGKIYNIEFFGDAWSDDIILSGRDITGDLIDSSVPDDSKVFEEGARLDLIAEKVIKSLALNRSIAVVNQTGAAIEPFTADEIVVCRTGESVISFLHKYCRKRRIFLNTDERGNLVLFKANGIKTNNRIFNSLDVLDNTVISYRVKYNSSGRFWKYICKSQDAELYANSEDDVEGPAVLVLLNIDRGVDSSGSAFDNDIKVTREKEFKLEEGSGSAECVIRAEEEANVRRARAFEYAVTVQGFSGEEFWKINQFVSISDSKAGVQGTFLVKSVEYGLDSKKGSTTKLVCTNIDAYTSQAAINLRDRSQSDSGIDWVNKTLTAVRKRIIDE